MHPISWEDVIVWSKDDYHILFLELILYITQQTTNRFTFVKLDLEYLGLTVI